MTLVAIVTSGCITKNFKCWQLGSIAWDTGRRVGKRQVWQKCTKQSGAWVLSVVPSLDREQWRKPMEWICQAFSVSSQIIETEGGKAVFHLSYSYLFLEKKERQHVHLKLVSDDLILHFRQARNTCVSWLYMYIRGTTSGFSGHGVVFQNLVILSHQSFALVLCWFWPLMH